MQWLAISCKSKAAPTEKRTGMLRERKSSFLRVRDTVSCGLREEISFEWTGAKGACSFRRKPGITTTLRPAPNRQDTWHSGAVYAEWVRCGFRLSANARAATRLTTRTSRPKSEKCMQRIWRRKAFRCAWSRSSAEVRRQEAFDRIDSALHR